MEIVYGKNRADKSCKGESREGECWNVLCWLIDFHVGSNHSRNMLGVFVPFWAKLYENSKST